MYNLLQVRPYSRSSICVMSEGGEREIWVEL